MTWRQAPWDARSWRDEAACQDENPSLFFPVGATGVAADQALEAKAVCATCPVAEECLVFAVTTNQEYGIWGGLDEEERLAVRREWRRQWRQAMRAERGAGLRRAG